MTFLQDEMELRLYTAQIHQIHEYFTYINKDLYTGRILTKKTLHNVDTRSKSNKSTKNMQMQEKTPKSNFETTRKSKKTTLDAEMPIIPYRSSK